MNFHLVARLQTRPEPHTVLFFDAMHRMLGGLCPRGASNGTRGGGRGGTAQCVADAKRKGGRGVGGGGG